MSSEKVILIRLDKIGDLIATLPVDQILPSPAKWVINQGLGWIADKAKPRREYLQLDKGKAWESFFILLRFLETEKPSATIVFYAPWWVSFACWLARVPTRIGRLSQWHSFIFFNRGLRQSRSESLRHEADYNRELVEFGLGLKPQQTPLLRLEVDPQAQLLEKWQLQRYAYVVVHPGMFGSALNWPQASYNLLIEKLLETTTVVVTGTAMDEVYLGEIKKRWQEDSRVRILQDQLNLQELLALLATAKGLIAPSTGVLHMAASLGTPAVGIYSPIQVHHPKRWGPRGQRTSYLLPVVNCAATKVCLGRACKDFPCMEKILPSDVLAAFTKVVN